MVHLRHVILNNDIWLIRIQSDLLHYQRVGHTWEKLRLLK